MQTNRQNYFQINYIRIWYVYADQYSWPYISSSGQIGYEILEIQNAPNDL